MVSLAGSAGSSMRPPVDHESSCERTSLVRWASPQRIQRANGAYWVLYQPVSVSYGEWVARGWNEVQVGRVQGWWCCGGCSCDRAGVKIAAAAVVCVSDSETWR